MMRRRPTTNEQRAGFADLSIFLSQWADGPQLGYYFHQCVGHGINVLITIEPAKGEPHAPVSLLVIAADAQDDMAGLQ